MAASKFQLQDVKDAAERIRGKVAKTPLEIARSRLLPGVNIYLKKDCLMEGIGSVKARGACNTLMQLTEEQKEQGVITASAGNHAVALAYYGMKLGIPVTVVLPTTAPQVKVEQCLACNPKMIQHGKDLMEAKVLATKKAKEERLQYVNGYNDLPILAGQGVAALEVLEQMDNLGVEPDAIVIPVGGGGLLAGMVTVIQHFKPNMEIIAVESEWCPSFTEAIKNGKPVKVDSNPATLADALNVPMVGGNSFKIVRRYTNNFEKLQMEVVREEHIKEGILMLEDKEGIVVEGGGAITLAACLHNLQSHLQGKNVVLMLTGGNIDREKLRSLGGKYLEYSGEFRRIQTEIRPYSPDSIHGVEVIKETEISFLDQGGTFEWRGYGLRLHVPEGSLPRGMEECRINIKASLSGQFQLPEGLVFLSPVFWITAPCKFTKPVTLEIQHCALTEDEAALSHLSFVSANCTQRDLPYRFRQLAGGLFTKHSSYGSIQLSHFSGIGIIGRILGTRRSYCAHLYHTKKKVDEWRFYFVITQDLDANNTFIGEYYNSHFARREATLRVIFTDGEITLKIPEDGLVTGDGWRITPFSCPTILREDADQFKMGQWIPECQLIVQWEKEDQRPVRLRHRVDLIGAEPPYNFINLTLNPAVTPDVGDPSGIDSTPLSEDDLQDVRSAVTSLAGRWKDIGISLGVHISDLDGIASANPHSPSDCLREMLTKWLGKDYNVKRFGEPTWRRLVEAIKDGVGGNNPALAQTIAEEHPEKKFPAKEPIAPESEKKFEDSIRGVEVIKETEISFLDQGGTFEWMGYGLRLHVPKDSLPAGMRECRINIRASLSGKFQLPEDSDLLSPVFWIIAPCKFTKPVTLEIQHCALTEDEAALSHLSFVSANCTQRDLPYRFKPVAGGVFTRHSSYGSIQLSHFSGIGIIGRILGTQRSYCAHLYHTKKKVDEWRFYFVITQDLDANNMVVRKHYCDFAREEATLPVGFMDSEITLDIPVDGLVTREGWRIIPFTAPTISRKDADQFKKGRCIPKCQLIVQWEKEDQRPVRLRHRVDLIGAKPPYNFINLIVDPAGTPDVGDPSGIDSTPLNEHSLGTILDSISTLTADWFNLGVALGLSYGTLKEIESNYSNNARRCLTEMVIAWLQMKDNTQPSWQSLVSALSSPSMNRTEVANRIAKKHPS